MKKKEDILGQIKNNHPRKIKQYYRDVYSRFLPWAKRKFKATEAEIQAAYDKAFEIFCRKIKANQFSSPTALPETFLFGIGRNCLLKIKYPKKRKKENPTFIITQSLADSTNPIDEKTENDHRKKLLEHFLQQITPHCQKLIRARKLDGQSIAQITKENNYLNQNTAKVAISKCYKCLIKIADESRRKRQRGNT